MAVRDKAPQCFSPDVHQHQRGTIFFGQPKAAIIQYRNPFRIHAVRIGRKIFSLQVERLLTQKGGHRDRAAANGCAPAIPYRQDRQQFHRVLGQPKFGDGWANIGPRHQFGALGEVTRPVRQPAVILCVFVDLQIGTSVAGRPDDVGFAARTMRQA